MTRRYHSLPGRSKQPTSMRHPTPTPKPDDAVADARLITRPFLLLVSAHFLEGLAYASMLLLPLYLQHLRASRTEIGIIMATAAVSGLVVRPFVGWALDRLGRKPTLMVGTITVAVAMGLIGAIDRIGPLIYLQRALFGIGEGALFTAYFTFAADLVPTSRRTEGLALFGISGLVPLLVNPLSDRIGIASPDLRWFLPLVGVAVVLSLGILWVLPEKPVALEGLPPMREALRALRRRPLWSVWLATVAFAGLVAVFMTFATVAAEQRGIERAPSLWLTYALGAVAVRLLGARLPDRLGPANLVAPSLGLYVAAMVLAAGATTFADFLVAALCAGAGHGICFPLLTSQVVSRSPAAFRGSALATFTALWGTSELLVSPAFGAVADGWGDGAMFNLAAVTAIVCLAAWVLLEHRFGGESSAR